MSPPSELLSLFEVVFELDFADPDEAVPDVFFPPSSPVCVSLLASLSAFAPPPRAVELLLFVELPLPSTAALFDPPLPPVAFAFASPESPDCAFASPLPELFADALPVLPDPAVLVASPPLASWFWVTSPPSALELLFDVVLEEAVDEPEVALPEGSPEPPPELDVFFAELSPDAEPPVAFELLLFVALPLPETLALFEPPLPPCEAALALPESPEVAEASPPELVAVAPPVLPEEAVLVASPPFASWVCVTSPPEELLLLFAVVVLEELHCPEVADPDVLLPLDELVALDEQLDDVAANATS